MSSTSQAGNAEPGSARVPGAPVTRESPLQLRSDFASALPELGARGEALRPERPVLLALNEPLAEELGIDADLLRDEAGVRSLLGNALPAAAVPVAQVYAGHQFGAYNPRLGDGRALLLGELVDRGGRLRDVHLKGSGPTPFARADGYAPVGPMLREYLMGEAMHALGIPTTRVLAVIGTGRIVMRPESLDPLPGAVLVRTASSHLRVGTFQFVRSTGDAALLRRLGDHAIRRNSPRLEGTEHPYAGLLAAVIEAQAALVASWQLVGFVHGVMNTDNTTISGETIDYGPCAFIDAYDPAAVFSSIDTGGRYAYGRQPAIAQWNLTRFAESLLPLLSEDGAEAIEIARGALAEYGPAYDRAWLAGMRAKLGLGSGETSDGDTIGGASETVSDAVSDAEIVDLAGQMLAEMHAHRVDYTRFFRALADAARGSAGRLHELYGLAVQAPGEWLQRWLALSPDPAAMDRANPVYIPRNHLVEEALDAATSGDLEPFARILDVVARPFERRAGLERYELPQPEGSARFITYCGT